MLTKIRKTATKRTPPRHFSLTSVVAHGVAIVSLAACSGGQGSSAGEESALSTDNIVRELALGDRGREVEGVYSYLREYGYFPNPALRDRYPYWIPVVANAPTDPSYFGRELVEGVREYQAVNRIPVTGRVDASTIAMINTPRCAHPENEFAARDPSDKFALGSTPGGPWRWNKTSLTYRISSNDPTDGLTAAQLNSALLGALSVWQSSSDFGATDLSLSIASGTPDVEIQLFKQGAPPQTWLVGGPVVDFAAALPGKITYGQAFDQRRMGLNTNATWSATVKAGALHLESGLLHEIGHTLGLAHSSVSVGPLGTAIPIMAPFMNGGESHVLQSPDDRQGIESLFSFWQQMPGLAVDIGAGGASNLPQVWVISGGNSIWHYRNGSPGTFDQVPGDGAAIAVDGAGVPWVVSSNNSVWKWIGPVPPPQNAAWAWQKLPEGGVDIAAGGGQIWSISNTSDGAGNFFVKKWTGSAWDSSAGGVGVHVAVDWLGRPWVTQRNGLVWRLITSNGDINTLGTGAAAWQNIVQSDTNMSACGNDIGAGADGTVWLIGCGPVGNDFDIWLWDEQSAATSVSLQRLFIPMDGYASRITVAPNGRSWVTQSNGAIWQRAN